MGTKKFSNAFVGHGQDKTTQEERPVMSGELIFKLMDSHGMPLDLIQDLLEEHKFAFDVPVFITTAVKSKNYSQERLTDMLIPPMNRMSDDHKKIMLYCIERAYRDS